jgi:two-component system KDP operon response regulator KdpE
VSNSGARILAIDDEVPMQRLLRRNLEARGYHVETAGRAREGLELFRSWRPDLVVLDLNLPDMDGVDFIRELRETS